MGIYAPCSYLKVNEESEKLTNYKKIVEEKSYSSDEENNTNLFSDEEENLNFKKEINKKSKKSLVSENIIF